MSDVVCVCIYIHTHTHKSNDCVVRNNISKLTYCIATFDFYHPKVTLSKYYSENQIN